jgi:predicted dehydrogenase
MKRRLGAILGFGNVALHGHLPAWQRRGGVRIIAVADVDPERRQLAARHLPRARLHDDPAVLLEGERVDFVDIATPPARHAPLILHSAARRCHVLCEKPLVTSLPDLRAAEHAAHDAHVVLCTVHNWKHAPQFVESARLLDEGVIGKVRRIRLDVERVGQSVTVGSPWRTDAAEAGGGILFDHGWHNFYLLLGLARERPLRVRATIERGGGTNVEDTADCMVEFPSLTGEIHLTWAGNRRRSCWRIDGENGSIEIEEDQLRLRRGSSDMEQRTFAESLSAGSHHPDWFDAVIDEFFAEIDGRSPRGGNLREAALCLTLIVTAYQSAAAGRPLDLPPELDDLSNPSLPIAGRSRPSERS